MTDLPSTRYIATQLFVPLAVTRRPNPGRWRSQKIVRPLCGAASLSTASFVKRMDGIFSGCSPRASTGLAKSADIDLPVYPVSNRFKRLKFKGFATVFAT